jgi:hypothetical protein
LKNKFQKKSINFLSIFIFFVMVFIFLFNTHVSQAEPDTNIGTPITNYTPKPNSPTFDNAKPDAINPYNAIEVRAIDPAKVGKTVHEVNTEGGTVFGCGVGDIFNGSCLLVGILEFNGMLLSASAALFGVVVDADKLQAVVANPKLYIVWMEVRDFLNIAFILFLLYSAFSIIFQIGGKFGEKKIILTIVLMALLVNFSFPIARFIVDVSNSLMYTMLAQFFPAAVNDPTSIFTGITTGSAVTKILDTRADASYPQLFTAIFFIFLLAMTFLALAILFLVRIVALAILIIVSPIAFVGNIAGKDFGWWDNMIKYAFFGPIMVFVLHIAIFTMSAIGEAANLASNDNTVTNMANFAIPIVILWMGMGIAQKMGIEGASTVMGAAQKASTWLPKLIGSGVKSGSIAGLKAIDRNTLANKGWSPRQFMAAWKQTTDRAEKDKLAVGTGKWNDRLNKAFGGEETHYEHFAREGQIAEKQKEQALIYHSSEELLNLIEKNKGRKGIVSQYETIAAVRTLAKSNDTNDFMLSKQKDINAFGTKENEKDGIAQDGTVFELLKTLEATGLGQQEAMRQVYQLGEIGLSSGNAGLFGAIKVNEDGTFERNTREAHAEAAAGKLKNIEPQELIKKLHPDALYARKWVPAHKDPATGEEVKGKMILSGLTDLGEKFFSEMINPAIVGQLSRARSDFRAPSNAPVITEALNKLKATLPINQAANIDEFIQKSAELAGSKESKGNKDAQKVKESSIEVVSGNTNSSRGKTTFDANGKPVV